MHVTVCVPRSAVHVGNPLTSGNVGPSGFSNAETASGSPVLIVKLTSPPSGLLVSPIAARSGPWNARLSFELVVTTSPAPIGAAKS